MNRFTRIFWLLVLAVFVGGCSSYRLVPPREQAAAEATAAEAVYDVKPGASVRVTLVDGERLEGKVLASVPGSLALEVHKRSGGAPAVKGDHTAVLVTADIGSVERRSFDAVETAILFGAIVAPVALMAASFEGVDMSMDSGNWGSPYPY